eukprot:4763215-Alexandrium_andersonii.AAC.2
MRSPVALAAGGTRLSLQCVPICCCVAHSIEQVGLYTYCHGCPVLGSPALPPLLRPGVGAALGWVSPNEPTRTARVARGPVHLTAGATPCHGHDRCSTTVMIIKECTARHQPIGRCTSARACALSLRRARCQAGDGGEVVAVVVLDEEEEASGGQAMAMRSPNPRQEPPRSSWVYTSRSVASHPWGRLCPCARACVHVCLCVCVSVCACPCACAHALMHMHARARLRACVRACVRRPPQSVVVLGSGPPWQVLRSCCVGLSYSRRVVALDCAG